MKKSIFQSVHGVQKVMAAFFLVASGTLAFAQDGDQAPPPVDPELEKPPPLPPKVQDEQIEPTVTIREEEDRRIEEYSLNGRVYMVKITPETGPPYYFIDMDGDGTLEPDERTRAFQPVQPTQWKIKEWK
jgi:hypothetical protein